MSPIAKIPVVLIITRAVTASLTIPSSPLSQHERRPDKSKNTRYMRFIAEKMGYIRGVFWVAAVAEIATILSALGSSSASNRISRLLIKNGTADDLCLTPLTIMGGLSIVAGSLLRLQCFRSMKDFFTFEISIRDNHKLVTTGPYSVVRHPSYTGSLMGFFGLCCWYGGRGSWVRESGVLGTVTGMALIGLFVAIRTKAMVSLLQRMPEEDKLLKDAFGEEWEEWARRVPYWLIPGLY
ncbi:hypothetical protein FPV67DRAFT_1697666 [Lyophyllum atratum]|nr:hypothetical protein FPV67DRAFT_1697666 [Lyophyllum atratum]